LNALKKGSFPPNQTLSASKRVNGDRSAAGRNEIDSACRQTGKSCDRKWRGFVEIRDPGKSEAAAGSRARRHRQGRQRPTGLAQPPFQRTQRARSGARGRAGQAVTRAVAV